MSVDCPIKSCYNDIMEKMGITEEQLEAMTESMNDLMSMSDDGSFEPGGAVPFPSELLGQFGMNANGDGTEPATRESQPNDKKKKENFHKSKRKHIAAYCTDLTMKARNGELDAIIGREREIERVVQILSRRTKNNPVIIGEAGVGKTAVAEALAQRIVETRNSGRFSSAEDLLRVPGIGKAKLAKLRDYVEVD